MMRLTGAFSCLTSTPTEGGVLLHVAIFRERRGWYTESPKIVYFATLRELLAELPHSLDLDPVRKVHSTTSPRQQNNYHMQQQKQQKQQKQPKQQQQQQQQQNNNHVHPNNHHDHHTAQHHVDDQNAFQRPLPAPAEAEEAPIGNYTRPDAQKTVSWQQQQQRPAQHIPPSDQYQSLELAAPTTKTYVKLNELN